MSYWSGLEKLMAAAQADQAQQDKKPEKTADQGA